ncbi:YdgH/BhsA/McbA-like domain containing protein [Citrobacter enshiensis]|uniref:YdgH/BhsA/McbA-like domain containing protein n=1 Tax=Citrobacter enshiensis TaxID=2971264 RepID=UPI0023E8C2F2|nr:YdgH/BhsA/McbA-like domain containing protein [Citrobacter enshiensis]WET42311.1 DUF1471 domain-containing protein [Citrobacter enshiensis]
MMKNLLHFSIAVILIALPITTFAVDSLTNGNSASHMSGTLTVKGNSVEEVESTLKSEAINSGASAYTITTESNDAGQVYGKATLYK